MGHEPGRQAPPALTEAGRQQAAPLLQQPTPPASAEDKADLPCPICGGTHFRWGWLESGLYGIGKGPAAATQPKYVRQKTRFGDFLGLRARLCDNCGHVEIFACREEGQ